MEILHRVLFVLCFGWTLSTGFAQQEYLQNPYLQSGLTGGLPLEQFFAQQPIVQPRQSPGFSSPSAPGQFGGASPFAQQPLQQALPQAPPSAPQASSIPCPERNIRFPHPQQCDAYVECQDGVGKEKLCPDGLLFNSKASIGSYPCQYPVEVDCEGRTQTQPANPTDQCPHQFGLYKMGDENQCGQYLNCANGAGFITDCPEGLAFNEASLQCDWPDQVANCNAEGYLGFTCPLTGNSVYDFEAVRFYKHPSDCQKYFHCVKGRPRLYSCGGGQAFNEFLSTCDGVENVTGCGAPPGRPIGRPTLQNKLGNNNFNQANPGLNQAFGGNSLFAPDLNQRSSFNQPQSPFNQPQSLFSSNPNSPDYTLPPYIQPPRAPTSRQQPFNRPNNFGNSRQSPNFRNGPRGSRNFPNNGPIGGFRSNPLTRRQLPFDSPNVRYARRN